jgi:hypothetical protein
MTDLTSADPVTPRGEPGCTCPFRALRDDPAWVHAPGCPMIADRTGWYEFQMPGGSTTHIGYVYEGGSVYLPEGPDVVTESDFRLASATESFWRLVRAAVSS